MNRVGEGRAMWGVRLVWVVLWVYAVSAWAELPRVVSVCDDGSEWPPYTFYKRVDGVKSAALTGFSVEYLQRVLARKGVTFELQLIPWARCLELVDSGKFDMLLNASSSPERERMFWVTRPYYEMTQVYFYDLSRPKPAVGSVADLKKLRLCGVRGYNYAPLGLGAAEIDTGAASMERAFEKVRTNRCDAVPERLEVVIGYRAIGAFDFAQMGLSYAPVPGAKPTMLSMMVSRHVPYAQALLAAIDEGIEEINRAGGAVDLQRKYDLPVGVAGM